MTPDDLIESADVDRAAYVPDDDELGPAWKRPLHQMQNVPDEVWPWPSCPL